MKCEFRCFLLTFGRVKLDLKNCKTKSRLKTQNEHLFLACTLEKRIEEDNLYSFKQLKAKFQTSRDLKIPTKLPFSSSNKQELNQTKSTYVHSL